MQSARARLARGVFRFFLTHMARAERWWVAIVSLLFIAPGLKTMALGLVLWLPILMLQLRRRRAL